MSKKPALARRIIRQLDPFFSQKSVDGTKDPLLKLLKLLFTYGNITVEEFCARHADWWSSGFSKSDRSTQMSSRNNLRLSITDKPVTTWDNFCKIVYQILRLEVKGISITIVDPKTKKLVTINSWDSYESIVKQRDAVKNKSDTIT